MKKRLRQDMFRTGVALIAALALVSCDKRPDRAKQIVQRQLGAAQSVEFRNVRGKGDDSIVCGEVMSSDKPEAGWRHFVAYLSLGRAAIAPTSEPMSVDSEMGNPMLAGEAYRFNHACD